MKENPAILRRPRRLGLVAGDVLVHAGLVAATVVLLAPFAWMVCAAFKGGRDVFRYAFLPWGHLDRLTVGNFSQLIRETMFARWMLNSLFISATQTVLAVTFGSMGGFALAKYRFAGKRLLTLLMLGTLMVPGLVLLPGTYVLMYGLGMLNNYAAVILPGAVSVFGMFLFRQAMLGVPDDLLHCARLDGCSELRLWWEIALPIVRPMVGAYTLLCFLGSWNSYLWPQVMLLDETKFPLTVGLAAMLASPEHQSQFGVLMAGTMLSILPVVVLFFVLQKDFVAGLASGALKG